VRNQPDVAKCVSCGTLKPGEQTPNKGQKSKESAKSSDLKPLSEMFQKKPGTWECDACLVRNQPDVVKCVSCGTLKAGASGQ